MENNKFRLTEEAQTMEDGSNVYRIEALKDFRDVSAGDLGGFIGSEENLSFDENDTSWVYDDSIAYGDSRVEADSILYKGGIAKNSHMLNESRVSYDSTVEDSLVQETQVQSSQIKNSKSFSSTIGQSDLEDSEVVFSIIGDTELKNSFIESSKTSYGTVIQNSHLENKSLRDANIVGEDTRLVLNEEDLEDLNNLDKEINQ